MSQPEILVLGSAVMDLVVHTDKFPVPGETVLGHAFKTFAGGKGANQAVAIAKLGGRVAFAGKLGTDMFGDNILHSLEHAGVNISECRRTNEEPTAIGSITVGPSGLNEIVVYPGANMLFQEEEAIQAIEVFTGARTMLLQLEIPNATNLAALDVARSRGMLTILNPAPAQDLPDAVFAQVDWLTPNEFETLKLTCVEPSDEASCGKAAQALLAKGAKNIVITLGPRGCYYRGEHGSFAVAAPVVEAKDTTGAGDAFTGALAYFLHIRKPPRESIELAVRVASISVTRHGAQVSMPTHDELFAMA